jgi:PEP-CTERM motif
MRLRNLGHLLISLSLATASSAFADTVTYATIGPSSSGASSVSGTIGSVGFTLTGGTSFVDASGSGDTNYFGAPAPSSTYTSSTVTNAPTDGALIGLSANGTETITFSTAVTGLILSEVSLGGGSTTTSYAFNDPFTVLSCGAGWWSGGVCFNQAVGSTGTTLSGDEANGTIEFAGPITSLTITTSNEEYWNGFDLGIVQPASPTPEPGTLGLVGTGIFGLFGLAKRKFAA